MRGPGGRPARVRSRPRTVLEWFVTVAADDPRAVEDWCDYAGYDATPYDDLQRELVKDVTTFLDRIRARPLRLTRRGRCTVLEWRGGDFAVRISRVTRLSVGGRGRRGSARASWPASPSASRSRAGGAELGLTVTA
jgi:hypothetical protein